MTDCFPEMVMPAPANEVAEEPEEPLDIPAPANEVAEEDKIIEEQLQGDTEEVEYEVEEEEVVPEPKRRPKIPQEEIFLSTSVPKVKTILEKEPPTPMAEKPKGRTKAGVGTRKKRGPATPEQLERLAKGRAKAAETRARKKKEKEEAKAKERADKDLIEAVREKERQKLRKKLEEPLEDYPSVKVVETEKVVEKGYSQKDLDDAVARAVEKSVNRVETLRKQRKQKKAEALAKQKHDEKVFQEVNRALKTDVWANCFL
tara:strand:- start:58 stop:834 length:777 start_codon:yes stop_codon:yes gene_type:complete